MLINENEFIWVEKYRPQTLNDLILPKDIKDNFKSFIESGKIPNILLTSSNPGLGKTSIAKILAKETNADFMTMNGNLDTGVDLMRTRVMDFCSAGSFDNSPKILLIDEAENLSPNSLASVKTTIETFTNVSFIFTANYVNKIPEPVRNRMLAFNFDEIYSNNKPEILKEIAKRLIFILQNENVEFQRDDIPKIIKLFYPSVRGMIQNLQRYTFDSKLRIDDSIKESSNMFNLLVESIKNKDFKEMRKISNNILDCGAFYEYMFRNIDIIKDETKPECILILARYQNMSETARDKLITLCACCIELMSKCKFE